MRRKKMEKSTLKEIARELEKTMQCNCDLDRWEPERTTGHESGCRIHKAAVNHSFEVMREPTP
jgi:hypothetical protein